MSKANKKQPEKVIVIFAHPDDAEGNCGGTTAKWAREGKVIYYLALTNGDKGSWDLSIPISTPWEVNLLPAFAKDTEAATQVVRLPVSVSASLMATSLALSLVAGGLASYVMGRRTARIKPAEILRKL